MSDSVRVPRSIVFALVLAASCGAAGLPNESSERRGDIGVVQDYPVVTLAEVADRATAIVIGQFAQSSRPFTSADQSPYIDISFDVVQWLKGTGSGPVVVRQAGDEDQVSKLVSKKAVLFLSHDPGTALELQPGQYTLTFGPRSAVYLVEGETVTQLVTGTRMALRALIDLVH
jgi:hypothetical protein